MIFMESRKNHFLQVFDFHNWGKQTTIFPHLNIAHANEWLYYSNHSSKIKFKTSKSEKAWVWRINFNLILLNEVDFSDFDIEI